MSRSIGLTEREKKFIRKWSAIRAKGRTRYVWTRGICGGLLLFAVWLIVTLIEISMSEFLQAVYTPEELQKKSLIWFTAYLLIGFVLSTGRWKGMEEKYEYLSPD